MEAELRIAAALSRRPFAPITTHQLAKLVGKSYSFTYTAVQRMAKAGMIQQQAVGHATLCSLVLSNLEVQALLALHAAQNRKTQRGEHGIAKFTAGGTAYLLCASTRKGKNILLQEQAKEWVTKIDFSTLEIESGAAYFWAVVGDAHA